MEVLVAAGVASVFVRIRRSGSSGVDAAKVVVELALETAEELEDHDEEDDANAGAREGPLAGDVPGAGDEAGVDRVPVPEHLTSGVSKHAWRMRL